LGTYKVRAGINGSDVGNRVIFRLSMTVVICLCTAIIISTSLRYALSFPVFSGTGRRKANLPPPTFSGWCSRYGNPRVYKLGDQIGSEKPKEYTNDGACASVDVGIYIEFKNEFTSNECDDEETEVGVLDSVVQGHTLPNSKEDMILDRRSFCVIVYVKEDTGAETNKKCRSRLDRHRH